MQSGSGGDPHSTGVARQLLNAATSLAAICVAASWAATWIPVWPSTLFEHFRVQYVVVGAVVLAAALALRLRRYTDIAAIATLLHALPLTADLTASAAPVPARGAAIRVLLLNVHTESSSFERVRRLIADEQPDVVGLVEVDTRWLAELAPALGGYPSRIEHSRPDNFGIALYARGPMTGAVEMLGSSLPSIVADLVADDARLRVVLTHPLPPMTSAAYDLEDRELEAIARRARKSRGPIIVMGDFNTSPWSRLFAQLVDHSGLCDSRAGFGIQASFPATMATMRIPIDHVLASCSIGVRDRRIGRDVGSDHLPVIVELVLPR